MAWLASAEVCTLWVPTRKVILTKKSKLLTCWPSFWCSLYCYYLFKWSHIAMVVYLVQSRTIKCSLDAAKRKFYRATNSIFSKVGRIASEEVVLHLITSECMLIWLYGLEVLHLNNISLDFVANRFCMKLFKTGDMQTVEFCGGQFNS